MPDIEREGVRIHFEDLGSGPAVVLGHSFLCSGEMWREQVEPLARNHRVVNVDIRGHGRSGQLERPFDLYDMVDDTIAVLDHLGIARAVWAGLSIGGMIGLRAALTEPDRVHGLILVDTHAGAETTYKKLKYRAMGLGTRAVGVRPFVGAVSKLMFGATTLRDNRRLVEEWKERFASVDLPSVLLVLDALIRRDTVTEKLPGIAVPALVIVGEEDVSLPPRCSEVIAAGLPDSRLEVIAGAGHLSALERPEEVTAAMLGFLGELG